ncbi:MAG TPA: hypothetical protein VFF59_02385, partial [Anaerolineae bacterium]|nr:hypothetical protein [Anaerolineae bacterium]
MLRTRRTDLLILAILLVLPLMLFGSVALGGQTLLPADNLFQFQPWQVAADQFGAQVPQNQLLSDLVLENYAWKKFIVESIQQRDVPLWNPNLFAGAPFLANGQHSAYYPFSIIFYVLPLANAYGWFTVSQLFLAGAFMYVFCRVLGLGRLGSAFAAITCQLSGFYIVSVVFSMIIAAAAWLPLLLAMIEMIVQQRAVFGRPATLPWVLIGAIALACQLMAGHIEITYYTLLIMALFAVWRLSTNGRRIHESATGGQLLRVNGLETTHSIAPSLRLPIRPIAALVVMIVLGVGLAAIQILPLAEILPQNFREGSATFEQVRSYGYPPRHVLEMLMPNFFGSPAEHTVLNLFTGQTVPMVLNARGKINPQGAYSTMWGIKNYVEGGAYVGLLPLLLALVAISGTLRGSRIAYSELRKKQISPSLRPAVSLSINWFFIILALISLAFMFGTPLYAILYYGLPGINQLHSPFRWVWPFTISIAVLAAMGIDRLMQDRERDRAGRRLRAPISWAILNGPLSLRTVLAGGAFWIGAIIFVGLWASRLIF